MSTIKLHPTLGVNPTIPLCFYCNQQKNELILLGAAMMNEVPPGTMCFDHRPCDQCAAFMKQGVIFISIKDGETDMENPYRTGKFCVMIDEAMLRNKDAFPPALFDGIMKRRVCFIEDAVWTQLGFPTEDIDNRPKQPAPAPEPAQPEGKPTISKITSKPYACEACGYTEDHSTNHYGKFYNTRCKGCHKYSTWVCQIPCPPDMDLPPEWKTTTLGEVLKQKPKDKQP